MYRLLMVLALSAPLSAAAPFFTHEIRVGHTPAFRVDLMTDSLFAGVDTICEPVHYYFLKPSTKNHNLCSFRQIVVTRLNRVASCSLGVYVGNGRFLVPIKGQCDSRGPAPILDRVYRDDTVTLFWGYFCPVKRAAVESMHYLSEDHVRLVAYFGGDTSSLTLTRPPLGYSKTVGHSRPADRKPISESGQWRCSVGAGPGSSDVAYMPSGRRMTLTSDRTSVANLFIIAAPLKIPRSSRDRSLP